ncbi:uncharacterized protein G2W53_004285 [Senna tora]|uniref:Uncharacterized protein n=1 Tax=Senna tora TaxID=362788 RepID=A0A834XCS1_9FABA|nr:uncharacterized protein G2W53_004285 [Senna tora]
MSSPESVATIIAGGGVEEDHVREEEEGKKKKSTVRCFTLGSACLGDSGGVDGSSAVDVERKMKEEDDVVARIDR